MTERFGQKPLQALDLYCGAGGVALGLQQAGFHVLGVDIRPQPRYVGDAFLRTDALEYLAGADLERFDLIWASPPCQRFTSLRHAPGTKAHPDLIGSTREALLRSGKPWVIENVVGAPLRSPIVLCGSIFGLRTPDGAELRRHRLFETSFPIAAPPCRHGDGPVLGVYGGHFRDRRRPFGANHRSGSNFSREHGYAAMGIDWMTTAELSEAIPPAFARFVAGQWLRSIAVAPALGRPRTAVEASG
jgi:DNA (cytosine-5)-methyltransferase 1